MGLTYNKITRGICVTVFPVFLSDESDHEEHIYMWAYCVQIKNDTQKTIQLCQRHWKIMNANGFMQEISGAGVLGKMPYLLPGESYEYASGATLSTPSGMMLGSYEIQYETGEWITIEIPPFSLDSPYQKVLLN